MSQFTQPFFSKILSMEGGYQDDSADVGNYACDQLIGTNRGISAVALKAYLGRCPTKAESKGITDAFAWDFYNWYFGEKSRWLEVDDQATAELLMNNHMGAPARAAEAAQRAMNRFGYALEVDGNAGSKTIAAINNAVQQNKVRAYNAIREEWIAYLNTTNSAFRQGLLNRMADNFPPLVADPIAGSDFADIEGGGAMYQVGRAKAIFSGAFRGDPKDLAAVVGLLLGLGVMLLAVIRLTAQKPLYA